MERHAARTPEILAAVTELAGSYNIHIAGSLPEMVETEGGSRIFNTLYIVGPAGMAGSIRKQRLFSPMAEDRYFTAGNDPKPVLTDLGLLAGVVCFDLRFPELARAQVGRGAQLLLVSAQWPAARRNHWRILLQARAIENQVFVIGCNRCGITADTEFGGHSMIIAPDGTILAEADEQPSARAVALDPGLLAGSRRLFNTVC
jgi:predicted amidohydrolase